MIAAGRAAWVAFLLGNAAVAQAPWDDALRALSGGDSTVPRDALIALFAADHPDRNQVVHGSLEAFRDAGATDVWMAAARSRIAAHPQDAMLQFYAGVTAQDLKRLGSADAALAKAREIVPADPGVHQAFVWNAVLRFDPATALSRLSGATYPGVEELRAAQHARLNATRKGAPAAFGLLGIVLTAAAAWFLTRTR